MCSNLVLDTVVNELSIFYGLFMLAFALYECIKKLKMSWLAKNVGVVISPHPQLSIPSCGPKINY